MYYSASFNLNILLASLASNAAGIGKQSDKIDNTGPLWADILFSLTIKTGISGTLINGFWYIYALGSTDGGTTWTDGATGTAGTFTMTNPSNARPIGSINATANAALYHGGPWSVAAGFGGTLPQMVAIAVVNSCGSVSDTTEANFIKTYQGVVF